MTGYISRYNGSVTFGIRDSSPADFETLWSIDQRCFPAGISYTRTELQFYMRRKGAFTLVAIAQPPAKIDHGPEKLGARSPGTHPFDHSIAGFIVAEPGRTSGHIITIDVVADARRYGVGSLLLRGAEDRLRNNRCRSVGLETAVDNVAALAFYKRHGYSVVRTFPRYYSNGVDALVLEKDLQTA
jgi:ribosomal-protein-alanine N-acetyltransferase